MDEKEIENKKKDLHEQIARLEEERKKLMVDEGKAFHCKKCEKFVEKCTVSTEQENLELCCRCIRQKKLLERKKELLDKLKGARVVDIHPSGFDSLMGLALYSNGILFELRARSDGDEQWIDIVENKKQLADDTEVRPGSKPRVENPLERYVEGGCKRYQPIKKS